MEQITQVQEQAIAAIEAAADSEELEDLRIKYLGKKGEITALVKGIRDVPPDQRGEFGKKVNEAKQAVTSALKQKQSGAGAAPGKPKGPMLDVTLPGRKRRLGRRHPISRTTEEIKRVFGGLGFEIASGPEVETEHYNFDALNIPKDHPARDGFDTFYLNDGRLLRSQTSTVQIRVMEKRQPPLRIIAPGRVYRPDIVDATHHYMFHQVEGLVVDENVTFADMKYVLEIAIRALFGQERKMRLLPSFFPFTEPSAEVFMSYDYVKEGKQESGWLEIAGCGMVDPNVFEAVGYPPGKYTGFAFGFGLDRIAMLQYDIKDIRLLTENHQDFLHQF
ncbi:MAG: phenylalanine--tRNA ligase subunit alpha [Planctomycetota bacterium]|jgi:phenylalanyl-tRNA synthetase alpha chain|nr:phenylalanine--tRNA ligase subunit alpha [Planctomycetota bacterium]MDP7131951.1 phenylalanine--tRNA ligase subunit alpha [Planctomycetota bacterium]MDP7252038.1 phenylalanine--tRNA ligase subunit alpha [Planctomycetota bacterium]